MNKNFKKDKQKNKDNINFNKKNKDKDKNTSKNLQSLTLISEALSYHSKTLRDLNTQKNNRFPKFDKKKLISHSKSYASVYNRNLKLLLQKNTNHTLKSIISKKADLSFGFVRSKNVSIPKKFYYVTKLLKSFCSERDGQLKLFFDHFIHSTQSLGYILKKDKPIDSVIIQKQVYLPPKKGK